MNETSAHIRRIDPIALADVVEDLLVQLRAQRDGHRAGTERVAALADKFYQAAMGLGRSHSGSNFGYHGTLYYEAFQSPPLGGKFSVEWGGINGLPHGWKSREPEEVQAEVERISGVKLKEVDGVSNALLMEAKKLRTEMLIRLAPLHSADNAEQEKGLLLKLENFDWQENAHNKYCSAALKSFPNMSRDSEAVMEGFVLPPHTYYAAVGRQTVATSESIQQFWADVERLLRQLQQLQSQSIVVVAPTGSPADVDIEVRYERLKTGVLVCLALLISFLLAFTCEVLLRLGFWTWLANHPNSYAIRTAAYIAVLLISMGLFVRRFRAYCWGFALLPVLAVVIQALGGPRR